MNVYLIAPGIAVTAVLVLAGCNSHTDKIRDIQNNPSGFAHHDVTVAGEVTKVYELPLGITDIAAYRVTDGTGQIWVISHAGAPREGDKVGVKVEVQSEGNIAGTSLGAVIQEKQRGMK